jgi:hypothetical protein
MGRIPIFLRSGTSLELNRESAGYWTWPETKVGAKAAVRINSSIILKKNLPDFAFGMCWLPKYILVTLSFLRMKYNG